MNGLKKGTGGHTPALLRLPAQDIPDMLGLAFADHKLLSVIQREKPALAGNHAHFPDLLHVHQGVPMDSSKGAVLKTVLNRL